MKTRTTKLSLLAFIGLGLSAYGQVGINNPDPKATLHIDAKTTTGSINEGILIPRVTTAKVQAMTGAEEATLVYVSDGVAGTGVASEVSGKGFYFFDKSIQKWNKLGATIYKTREVQGGGTITLTADDYFLIKKDSGAVTWTFDTAGVVNGRKICIFNDAPGTSGSTLTISPQPRGLYGGSIYQNSGLCYIYYGGKWYGSEGGN
ncbi:hypothetical protein [Riemerella anatipestifer]|uniref:hypothetical protein n=1 Tax=Riemerella anatipestifer TaxID=34085 RepID=UPI00129ECA60|nr:hypothetical protein [Riemerella anatipestifer]MBT0552585.1 hypothetical protein [Riemerella anatipestifer]MBT0554885.1 hypothetical protein [Riemerella anatipestifer]MCU7543174.1 hypothetical protein [Riemerella anatipestifer]MCU7561055.1 hypothetical protein [Riemerella anatipestifer]MCW0513989.1 hypothetical protein [Riemerella anatipestifer]